MKTEQYSYDNIRRVFWAYSDDFKSGRDPMGIQNSSIATYGKLLPGMTNLTGHIRYYSLYCWLLVEYSRLSDEIRGKTDQYNFIRRAELIMSFIMRGRGLNSVIGSDFIDGEKYRLTAAGAYDIAGGADYENKDRYWAYPSGAFGQYYLGSLIHYKLVRINEKAFYTGEAGRILCKAFEDSVPENVRELYVKRILEGILYPEDIPTLGNTALDAVETGSAEWHELNNLLTKVDTEHNSSLRRETIYLLLNDLKEKETPEQFVENRFLRYNNSNKEPNAEFGWYFYYLCEIFHYGIETVLCYILNKIDALHNPELSYLLDESTEEICSCFEEDCTETYLEEFITTTDAEAAELFHTLKSQIKKALYAEAVATAVGLFGAVYIKFHENRSLTEQFENINDLKRQRGILSTGLKDYVEKYFGRTLKSYIRAILVQVMNEHSFVAVSKMGHNGYDVRKFLIDDGCAVLIEIRYPTQTNPRISSLHNFLIDLGYITKENALTGTGTDFLNSYGKQ